MDQEGDQMAWIKVDPGIYQHPKIDHLAMLLNIETRKAADLCIRVFCWAKTYAEKGHIGYESKQVERGIGWDCNGELLQKMQDCNLIDGDNWINDWHEWGGAEIAERARKNPEKYSDFLERYSFQEIPGKSRNDMEIPHRGEEKRGDKKRTEINTYSPEFEAFWTAYPYKVGKPKAYKAYLKIIGTKLATHEALLTGVERYKLNLAAQRKAEGWAPQFKMPESWLNAARWEDPVYKSAKEQSTVRRGDNGVILPSGI